MSSTVVVVVMTRRRRAVLAAESANYDVTVVVVVVVAAHAMMVVVLGVVAQTIVIVMSASDSRVVTEAEAVGVAIATAIDVPLADGVLVVVHPYLEHGPFDADLGAELLDQLLVPFLHLPPDSLSEFKHPLLLVLAEFRPEPLSRARVVAARAHHRGRGGRRGALGRRGVLGRGGDAGGEREEHVRRGRIVGG